jgi:hypothetical protein
MLRNTRRATQGAKAHSATWHATKAATTGALAKATGRHGWTLVDHRANRFEARDVAEVWRQGEVWK